ncbi:MAG: DEAD/DEAH box helicase [Actinomycetota bacterium]
MIDIAHFEALLTGISSTLDSEGLKSRHVLKAVAARGVDPDPPLPEVLAARLEAAGIRRLWSHQAEALDAVRRGSSVTVSTGTASGKSLCFNLPTIERILTEPRSRALYLYPTKALAQDQLRALRALGLTELTPATYDGDTPKAEREAVRKFANIVLTNPDMLHYGILPNHRVWSRFFANLQFVVVDEAHVLRGVFGSHVGCILRRLRRIAAHCGSRPVFILTSATVPNPGELARRLTGLDFTEVTSDGAPRGAKLVAFWNPPFLDTSDGARASANWETARILATFASAGIRTLAFAKSRKSAELVAKHAQSLVNPDIAEQIVAYRGGYLAEHRRRIERRLFSGELLGVAATTALELGIDVGGLDAVVMNGFPGTVAQMWQQAGRSGRSTQPSVAVMVGQDDPLDQYYISHTEILLSRPYEVALVDTGNPNVLGPHLCAAAYEEPIEADEIPTYFGQQAKAVAGDLVAAKHLVVRKVRGTSAARYHRAAHAGGMEVDLRSIGGPPFTVVDVGTGAILGTVDGASAYHQVHPGSVYLHQGDNWEIRELDLIQRVALAEPLKGSYYTQPRTVSDIAVRSVERSKRVGRAGFALGRVQVTRQVVSYARRDISSGATLAEVDLDLPLMVLDTVAFWYTVDASVTADAQLGAAQLPGSLHAAEHAGIGLLPVFAMADRWDIGGVSTALAADTGLPTVFIYDGYPGGAGIAERGFEQARRHLRATLQGIQGCRCERGCPSCVQSPKCGNGNDPLDKAGAVRLLATIVGV